MCPLPSFLQRQWHLEQPWYIIHNQDIDSDTTETHNVSITPRTPGAVLEAHLPPSLLTPSPDLTPSYIHTHSLIYFNGGCSSQESLTYNKQPPPPWLTVKVYFVVLSLHQPSLGSGGGLGLMQASWHLAASIQWLHHSWGLSIVHCIFCLRPARPGW